MMPVVFQMHQHVLDAGISAHWGHVVGSTGSSLDPLCLKVNVER
jgi:hypothetical protein